ncbi:PA3496 family putative envelope integrity protein [Gilvimarinus sp. DA14]|uniref:PA3496 family putative envelope integrity protein n=1 Tax=Gilvimarinus sp. DA14 TaxID=2956798 RepID=UPI0020B83CBD|nr:hypothetical protein [Gilvimarinus sp. DA14]UTF59813.1 hypothetical protein NHM04_15280 [Gilvimarinus sp. DA14]
MTEDHDEDAFMDDDSESEKAETIAASAKDNPQRQLEMRRRLEDRLEKRRLRDELGFDDLWELEL